MAGRAGCLFCAIVAGETPAHVVLDTETVVAFLDHRPLFHGHTLVVPREHVVTLRDLPTRSCDALLRRGPARSRRRCRTPWARRARSWPMNNVVSQSVPHLHVHVVPRDRRTGSGASSGPGSKYADDAEADAVAASIREALPSRVTM